MKKQWILFLLIGTLSMFFAEVLSGASKVWLLDGWSILVTYPLYLFHLLFFLNLAFRTKRTTIPHLFLWGCIFLMYESWITQVLWNGYLDGMMGSTFLGIAVSEFFGLMFWHPIFSFILPILVFESLALSLKSKLPLEKRVIPSHVPFLSKIKRKYLYLLMLLGAVFMAVNNKGDIGVITGAFLVSYPVIYLFYKISPKDSFSIYSLKVSDKGFKIMTGYLILLYLATFLFFGVVGNRIPGAMPIISTLVLYAFFIWAVKSSKPVKEKFAKIKDYIGSKDLGKAFLFNIVLTYLVAGLYLTVMEAAGFLLLSLYLIMSVFSVFLLYKAFRRRK
jgi:hypothetical protein